MKSRGKTLIGIISVVVLVLMLLFSSRGAQDGSSNSLAAAGESASDDDDLTTTRVAAGNVSDTISVTGSNIPGGAMTLVANSSADQKPEAQRGKVAAQCWGLRGSAPWDFAVTLDREVRTSGKASALFASRGESAGFATMFQTSVATSVRGKRVEFSVDLRTRGATQGVNLLLRAEDARGRTVAFDNMQTSYGADRRPDQLINRGVIGDTEWSTQRVVVDIPVEAQVFTYGVSLFGGGKAWIDNARIEVVTNDVATTAIDVFHSPTPPNGIPVNPDSLTRNPRNLNFDVEAPAGTAPCN
jgi:hypothetical protein